MEARTDRHNNPIANKAYPVVLARLDKLGYKKGQDYTIGDSTAGVDTDATSTIKYANPTVGFKASADLLKAGQISSWYANPKYGGSGKIIDTLSKLSGQKASTTNAQMIYNNLDQGKQSQVVKEIYKHEGGSGQISVFENFNNKVDKSRKAGYTDTAILDNLSKINSDLKSKVDKSRGLYGKGLGIENDRDLLNFLSKKFSGQMPTVESVPLGGNQTILPTEKDQKYAQIANKSGLDYKPGVGVLPKEKPKEPGFLERAGRALNQLGQDIVKPFQEFGQRAEEIGQRKQGLSSTITQGASSGLTTAFDLALNVAKDVVSGTLKAIMPKDVETVTSALKSAGSKLADNKQVQIGLSALQKGVQGWDNFKKDYPELGNNMEAVLNIGASLYGGSKGAEVVGKQAEKMGLKLTEEQLAKKTAEQAVAKTGKTVERILPSAIGKTDKAEEVLKTINTNGVKTYKDLSEVVSSEKKQALEGVDKILESNKEIYKPEKLVKNGFNYVNEALKNLGEFYQGAKDIPNLNKVNKLFEKSQSVGLTAQEINTISREYGSEFGSKAFSKVSGEPLTSVNAQAFENVRKGVKSTVRDLFKDNKALETLDQRAGKLIETQKLVDDVAVKVSKLEAKLKNENALMKLGRQLGGTAGKAIDVATGGTARAFVSKFFPSNMGYKIMNYLDIQGELSKNLKLLDKLNNSSGNAFINNLEELIKSGTEAEKKKGTLFLPEPKPGAIQSEVKTPIELPAKGKTGIKPLEINNAKYPRVNKK